MDREMLQQHLQQTEEHIALSGKHLYDQRALIARLERDGHHDEATEAKELLTHLEETWWRSSTWCGFLRSGPHHRGLVGAEVGKLVALIVAGGLALLGLRLSQRD
jgi:hypothetical protein